MFYRSRDRIPIVLQKPENIECGRLYSQFAALLDDAALVRLGDRSASYPAQSFGGDGLDSEGYRAQTRAGEGPKKLPIEMIQSGLALELEAQPAAKNLIAQVHTPVPVLREKVIPEYQEGIRIAAANLLEFLDNICHGAGPVRRQNAVRAVGAELRTAAARKDREAGARQQRAGTHSEQVIAPIPNQVPSRKRETIEISHLLAPVHAGEVTLLQDFLDDTLRLSDDDEVRVILEQLRYLGTCQPDKSNLHAARAGRVC